MEDFTINSLDFWTKSPEDLHLDGAMQGFDCWEVLPGQGKYYNPEFITAEGKTNYKGRYVTEVITERAVNWLKTNTYTTTIVKWETKAWGEIPADFGRK